MNDAATTGTAEIIPFPTEEERVPVPRSFVTHARKTFQDMLRCEADIKADAVRKGNTMLAVKATSMAKTIRECMVSFEKLVMYCYEVIPDAKYKKLYPENYAAMKEARQ